ncbi:unnamed protein product [Phaeothamnion confervicola]
MIVCLAVVGRNQEPLFLRCYTDPDSEGANDAALRLHYIVHSSLDLVSEHARSVGRKVASDMFLGHLFPVEDYCVYGYLTSTHVKILAVLEDNDRIREADLQTVSSVICNSRISRISPLKCHCFALRQGIQLIATPYKRVFHGSSTAISLVQMLNLDFSLFVFLSLVPRNPCDGFVNHK